MSAEDYQKFLRVPQSSQQTPQPVAGTTTTVEPAKNSEEEDKDILLITQFVDITQFEDDKKDEPRVTLTPPAHQALKVKKPGPYEDRRILIRRHVKKDSNKIWQPTVVRLEIRDPLIINAFQDVLRGVGYFDLFAAPIKLDQPYRELFWFREEILQYLSTYGTTTEEADTVALLKTFIDERMSKLIKSHKRLTATGSITYELLWTILRPKSIVISVVDGLERALRVRQVVVAGGILTIYCESWDCDENRYGLKKCSFNVLSFDGVRAIVDLDVFPIEYLSTQQQSEIRARLIANGRKWAGLINMSHKAYNGVAWKLERGQRKDADRSSHSFLRRDDSDSYDRTRAHVSGRIILDHDTSLEQNPGSVTSLLSTKKILDASPDGTSLGPQNQHNPYTSVKRGPGYHMSDEQALICPRFVRGYSLYDKFWADFIIDDVKDIEWNDSCFDKLQIDEGVKGIIQTLVSQHAKSGAQFRDVVVGKGKGLAILLHGPPGSGKTLTAETMSENARKPLYFITSGELGTTADAAEKNLLRVFKLAQTWKAILLIDEADVFLAARAENISRNAFVSVFLRNMEYYQGILLLTTNRRGEFDAAFQSRIQLQIPYIEPDGARRAIIWKSLLNDQEGIAHCLTEETIQEFGHNFKLNGREIKNLIAMAMLVCQAKKKPLDKDIVQTLYEMHAASRP